MHSQVMPMVLSGVVRVSYLVRANLTPPRYHSQYACVISSQISIGAHEPHNQYWDAYTVPTRSRGKTTATPSPASLLPVSPPTLLFIVLRRPPIKGTVVGMLTFGWISDKLGRKFGMARWAL